MICSEQAVPIPFDRFKAELLALYRPSMRSPATRRGMVHALGVLEGLGVQTTGDLQVGLIAKLVETRPPHLSPHSVKALLRYIQAASNVAAKCGYLRVSPFAVRPIRDWVLAGKPKGKRHQTREEIRRILEMLAADVTQRHGWAQWRARRLQALVATVAFTGVRRGVLPHARGSRLRSPRALDTGSSDAPVED